MAAEQSRYMVVGINIELNLGFHEDSDSVRTTGPTTLLVLGDLQHGAIPVRIVDNGIPSEEIFYYHQPEPLPSQK